MAEPDPHRITTVDELTAVLGEADDIIRSKLGTAIDDQARTFIERARLLFVATSDADGNLDVSPKGDPAGFVHVLDDQTIVIPERKGNKLAFGPRNILDTGRIGLLFVVPGTRETLRINGSAALTTDPALLERLHVDDKPALLCTTVTVEECFFHCAKSFIRSEAWKPDSWPAKANRSPIAEQMADKMGGDDALAGVIDDALEQNYVSDLY